MAGSNFNTLEPKRRLDAGTGRPQCQRTIVYQASEFCKLSLTLTGLNCVRDIYVRRTATADPIDVLINDAQLSRTVRYMP